MYSERTWAETAVDLYNGGATQAEVEAAKVGFYRAYFRNRKRRTDAPKREARLRKADVDPEIPGLLPIRKRGDKIVDFARVDLDDWERLRTRKFSLVANGYVQTRWEEGQNWSLHHIVLGVRLNRDEHPGKCCDHINRDKLDNRKANLRIVSYGENNRNRGTRR
jgi:hypothetical protein